MTDLPPAAWRDRPGLERIVAALSQQLADARQRELEAYGERLKRIEHEAPLPMHRVADHPDPHEGKHPDHARR